MNMVWMVTADTWTEGWGSSVYLVGIFDNEQEADDAVDTAKMRYKAVNKYAVKLNNRYDLINPFAYYTNDDESNVDKNVIYLGGYIE